MFVGHYGVSYAAKAMKRTVPLWVLFVAVQFLDVLWAICVLLGIEKVRIVPGITATNPLDLYYMPYTHGLPGAVVWSLAAAALYRVFRREDGGAAAGLVGAAVLSHWALDLLVHRPDLPLLGDRFKMGLGLWNYPAPAFLLESLVLFGGMYWYWRAARPAVRGGRYGMAAFGLIMLAVQATVFFGPPPASDHGAAIAGLLSYAAFAGVAYWMERTPAGRGVVRQAVSHARV